MAAVVCLRHRMGDDDRVVYFDDEATPNLRLLFPVKLADSQALHSASTGFLSKLTKFQEDVTRVMSVVQTLGGKIEEEKLRCTGMRNRAEGEAQARALKKKELQQAISEKQIELDRFASELKSLEVVAREQASLVSRLSANE